MLQQPTAIPAPLVADCGALPDKGAVAADPRGSEENTFSRQCADASTPIAGRESPAHLLKLTANRNLFSAALSSFKSDLGPFLHLTELNLFLNLAFQLSMLKKTFLPVLFLNSRTTAIRTKKNAKASDYQVELVGGSNNG